jgi:hypothetical protein
MPPLEAVDGTQITNFAVRKTHAVKKFSRPITIPNLDAGVT